ncbi:RNA polymerase sigma factor [Kerstersia gyiorum]|jgi:RNA polymerase sigma-70 factor (ECF subfamily)|uniref:RNA polymerase sigma factor n=1 Tax=Kerstersia gyiorum TaxID=206506 RepID=UPI002431B420|nr:sigma-70 family RNA polymerase sigma factor [Kerstersia gyiorum]MCH4270738.1 sigma-70 family RNA polymerase sigma factor [Kerstersia gyiorum]MCI1227409.1 sigma-70 family RNA polymerase sigma factor [Kerstersia gyiorum]
MEQGGLRQVERPGAYLARMAYHAAIDRLRQVEPLRGSPQGDEDYLQSLPDLSAGIEHIVAGRNALRVLVDSIDALPRRRQAIFVAIRLEALSHNEVARRFGLSLAVVRGELRKAHAHCAQALQWDGFGA